MSTISGISSGTSAAWADVSAARAAKKESLFAKLDTNGSGTVDSTELQGLLDKVAAKTGTTAPKAADVLAKLDTDGNGTLDKSELKAGIKSLLPAPNSTHEFAAQHVPAGSDPISKAPTFEQLDSDGDGTISKAEFSAGTAQASTDIAKPSDANGAVAPSGPPPGGGGGGGSGPAATSSSSGTTYDPLDTNKDGVVSAQEQAAGGLKNVLADLLKAIDTNGDKKISPSEVDTFQKNVAAALQTLAKSGAASTTAATATAVAGSSSSSSDSSSSSSSSANTAGSTSDVTNAGEAHGHHPRDFSLSAFANLVLKQYAATAGDTSSVGTSISVSA